MLKKYPMPVICFAVSVSLIFGGTFGWAAEGRTQTAYAAAKKSQRIHQGLKKELKNLEGVELKETEEREISGEKATREYEKIKARRAKNGKNKFRKVQGYAVLRLADGSTAALSPSGREYTLIRFDHKRNMIIYKKIESCGGNGRFKRYSGRIRMESGLKSIVRESAGALAAGKSWQKESIRERGKWEKKVREKYKKKYWYQMGYFQKDWMQIGQKAVYRINLSNLSSIRKNKCLQYGKKIRSCNSNYESFRRRCVAFDLSAKAVIAMIIINIAWPPAVIASVLLSAFTGLTASVAEGMVRSFLASRSAYKSAARTYKVIRKWGKKR